MDDILIFAEAKEELTQITKMVLEKLKENDLFLKAKKCEFYKTKVEYLGMIIKEGRISMDPVKLGGIRDWLCYDFKLLSDNRLYSCSVLGKLSIVNSCCTWF